MSNGGISGYTNPVGKHTAAREPDIGTNLETLAHTDIPDKLFKLAAFLERRCIDRRLLAHVHATRGNYRESSLQPFIKSQWSMTHCGKA